jgi:hypothetical protein
MVKLDIEKSPVASLPRRFLLSAPLLGMFAGTLLTVGGQPLLGTRWQPATVALVHAFTLGVLGNTMFGSVLQFLPAAAGVRVRGGVGLGHALHGLFNARVILLLTGMLTGWRAIASPFFLALQKILHEPRSKVQTAMWNAGFALGLGRRDKLSHQMNFCSSADAHQDQTT